MKATMFGAIAIGLVSCQAVAEPAGTVTGKWEPTKDGMSVILKGKAGKLQITNVGLVVYTHGQEQYTGTAIKLFKNRGITVNGKIINGDYRLFVWARGPVAVSGNVWDKQGQEFIIDSLSSGKPLIMESDYSKVTFKGTGFKNAWLMVKQESNAI